MILQVLGVLQESLFDLGVGYKPKLCFKYAAKEHELMVQGSQVFS